MQRLIPHAGWIVLVVGAASANCSAAAGPPIGFAEAGVETDGGLQAFPPPPSALDSGMIACPSSVDGGVNGGGCPSGYWCEYGLAADPTCNDRLYCNGGVWEARPKNCTITCPKTWDEVAEGSACSDAAQVCSFPEGTCGCVVPETDDAGVDASDDGDADASVTPRGRWTCVRPATGCPSRRPVSGSACVTEMSCDYGSDVFGMALTFVCRNHRWR